MKVVKGKLPTRKWWTAQVVVLGTFLVALIQNEWQLSSELQVVLVGIVVEAVSTYLVPNSDTPGGVPDASAAPDRTRPATVEPGGGAGV